MNKTGHCTTDKVILKKGLASDLIAQINKSKIKAERTLQKYYFLGISNNSHMSVAHVQIEACVWNEYGDHPRDYVVWKQIKVHEDERDFEVDETKHGANIVKRFNRPGFTRDEICPDCKNAYRWHGWIEDNSFDLDDSLPISVDSDAISGHKVCPGDYILFARGQYWTCKPALFHQLYKRI